MPDQSQPPANDRFKAEMPQIPGVSGPAPRSAGPGIPGLVIGGLAVVLVAVFVGGKMLAGRHHTENPAAPAPQIEVPATVPDLPTPVATESDPVIARVGELARPWDSHPFFFRNRSTGENVPALLLRLPGGSPALSSGYWALAMKEAYGNCQLEYVQDLTKLRNDYGYRSATHPMVGNPCSRAVYDPLKYAALVGNVLARGAIVQGSDLRPPLGIEIKIHGKDIFATQME